MSSSAARTPPNATSRVRMFGISLDRITMHDAVQGLLGQLERAERHSHMVVTPNTDHVVMLQSRPDFQAAYQRAFMVVADGNPVVWASRLLGRSLPETVPGSDLVPALLSALPKRTHKVKVFLFGAGPGVALRAMDAIHLKWGNTVEVVGALSPEFGFESNEVASHNYAQQIAASQADVLLVGLGAPKQELWSLKHQAQLNVKLVMCVGATIDFLAGEKQRSPKWMQRVGLEWLYRMCQEPRRLVKRYAKDGVVFPLLVVKEFVRPVR